MPGAKRESDGDVSPPAVKRSRGADPPRPDPPAAAHRDELGFEHDEAPSRALAASAGRCESAWSAFETTASCLGVDLEGRPEDVREFVRINGVGADSRARLWMAWSGAKEREAKAPRTYLDEVRLAFAAAADRAEEEDEADAAAEEEDESSGASDPSDPLFSRAPASARRPPRAPSDMARHAAQINLDVERTFPSHPDFRLPEKGAAGGNGRRLEPLRRVLMALAHAHPDVGYTQGMNFIAGWAMLALDASAEGGDGRRGRAPAPLHAVERSETSAFWLVSALLAGAFRGYFEPGLEALREDLDALDLAFCADHCAAWTRLAEHGCAVKFFCPRWLLCATVGAAPTAVALRVWDVFLVDADRDPRGVLLRVCAEALAMRQDAVRTAAGVGEAVEAVRAAPARVENVQGFLRRVRDAPRRDTRELAEAAERAKASEKKRREEHARRGEEEARKRRREAERASRVGPRAKATDAWRVVRERFAVGASAAHDAGNVASSDAGNAALSRPALTPFGNLLSMFQSATTPARAAAGVKPRRLVWGGQVGDDDDDGDDGGGGGGGGGGEDASGATPDRGAARGARKRKTRDVAATRAGVVKAAEALGVAIAGNSASFEGFDDDRGGASKTRRGGAAAAAEADGVEMKALKLGGGRAAKAPPRSPLGPLARADARTERSGAVAKGPFASLGNSPAGSRYEAAAYDSPAAAASPRPRHLASPLAARSPLARMR